MARAELAQSWARVVRGFDPIVLGWRLLTSVRFALVLIGFLALAGLLSVVLPQVPAALRDSPVAVQAWLEFQKGKFGPVTEPMHRLGLFDVFATRWFLGALVVLAISISAYAAGRLLALWRNVTRPQERMPETFFQRAANRLAFAASAPAGDRAAVRLEALLRRRRFEVRSAREGQTAYFFADRFAWAQLGPLVSHLAVVLLLAGALVSRLGGLSSALFIAEGTASPVFAVSHPDQMQVEVVDAVGEFDGSGSALDYRSELVIYQGGREVARGVATVNGPLSYGGYRFHQAGYFAEGAALLVRDAGTGRSLYREVLALEELVPAPAIAVRDAQGTVLLDDVIVPTDFLGEASGTLLTVPGSGRDFWVGVSQDDGDWRLVVYGREEADARFTLAEGESRRTDGLEFTFTELTGLPSIVAPGLPGDSEASLVVLSEAPDGAPYLTVLGAVDGRALTLYPDQPVEIGDKEYLFEGRREFAGIEVRRDPGANFIWVGVGLLLAGLLVTFYVPRLRLWARIRDDEIVIAGLAENSGAFQSEARRLAKELGGAPDAGSEEASEDA